MFGLERAPNTYMICHPDRSSGDLQFCGETTDPSLRSGLQSQTYYKWKDRSLAFGEGFAIAPRRVVW
jgi:hypothetical protein